MSTDYSEPFTQEKFQMSVAGDFGVFYTDKNSPVFYINTSFEIDNISQIKPVREILDVTEVDFEELVQRDLDDFRIKRDIVNYLTDGMGYKFFPPIVVAVTQPEENGKAIKKHYPELKTRKFNKNGREVFEIEFSDSFCIRWFLSGDTLFSLPTEIRWKNEQTFLMAVDGQHRLVSLQAIRGLIKNERLAQFYSNSTKNKGKLDDLKVPVTILLFPNSVENISKECIDDLQKYFPKINWEVKNRSNVKQVLRNIFVDVNKTAKQPSKSRTILLDEKDLTAVFTRKVFSSIKKDIPEIYTSVLEYNSLNGKETQIERNRSLITTIGIINNICEYLFKDSKVDSGTNLRIRLGVDELESFPSSEEFPSEKVKANEFSLEQREVLEDLFIQKWVHIFKTLFTSLIPYRRMIDNVNEEYQQYKENLTSELLSSDQNHAYKVLFGGSEERFILESNAKMSSNNNAKASLSQLKNIEKSIRNKVKDFNMYYTLMFQKGFFESLSILIQEGYFQNDHYILGDEFSSIINQLNIFIDDNADNSFFNTESGLYNLIIGGKASPDASVYIANLIVLILLNFNKDNNEFIRSNELETEQISSTTESSFDVVSSRIQILLGKEFDKQTENKQRKLDIKLEKEKGERVTANRMNSEYAADRDTFIEEKYKKQKKLLKQLLDI